MVRTILAIIGVVALVVGICLFMGFPVMWLWNYNMPHLFGVPKLDFWHAYWLLILCSILFRSYPASAATKK